MGTVVAFPVERIAQRSPAGALPPGRLVIFPGVRIERRGDCAGAGALQPPVGFDGPRCPVAGEE